MQAWKPAAESNPRQPHWICDMQNNNQVESKVGKWLPNGTPCRQIGKQLQFNGKKWQKDTKTSRQDAKLCRHQLLID